jgi:sulfite exporter TauE/SafE
MTTALFLTALAMGLLGSTHCVVMCGGVVGVLSGGTTQIARNRRAALVRSLRLALAYNGGRIASYAVAGAIAGAFGALVDRIPVLRGAELGLRLGTGALMLAVGLYLAGAFRRFAEIERIGLPLWRWIEPHARKLVPARTFSSALTLGALWGWMPCGLVYAALAIALGTGSAGGGALAMVAFGLGTLPTLLTIGAIAARVAELGRVTWVRRGAGVAIVAFGVFHVAAASAQIARGGASPAGVHSCCVGHSHGG